MTSAKRKKSIRIVGWVTLVLVVLFVIVQLVTNYYLNPIIDNLVQSKLSEVDAVEITYDKLKANLPKRSIKFFNVRINNKAGQGSNYSITVPEIKFKAVEIYDLVFNNKVDLKKIKIKRPNIHYVINDSLSENDTVTTKQSSTNPNSPSIEIKQIEIEEGSFNITQGENIYASDSFKLKIKGIEIDSTSNFKKLATLVKSIKIYVDKPKISLPTARYDITANHIEFSTKNKLLQIKDFKVMPLEKKLQHSKKLGYQIDRIDIKTKQISLQNINIEKLLNEQSIVASSLNIDSLNFEALRDKRVPREGNQKKALPQELMRELGFIINIDSIHVRSANLRYGEMMPNGQQPGYVYFNKLNGSIYNLTNDSLNGKKTKLTATALVMGEGYAQAELETDILDPNNSFSFKGSLGQMPLTAFNNMLTPTEFMTIEKGILYKMYFTVNANENFSEGELLAKYENFKVALAEGHSKKSESKVGEALKSFIINNFIFKSRNTGSIDELRKGKIYFERDKERSIINYCWKSLLSGIKPLLLTTNGELVVK